MEICREIVSEIASKKGECVLHSVNTVVHRGNGKCRWKCLVRQFYCPNKYTYIYFRITTKTQLEQLQCYRSGFCARYCPVYCTVYVKKSQRYRSGFCARYCTQCTVYVNKSRTFTPAVKGLIFMRNALMYFVFATRDIIKQYLLLFISLFLYLTITSIVSFHKKYAQRT